MTAGKRPPAGPTRWRHELLAAVQLYLVASVPGPADLLQRVVAAAEAGAGAVQLRLKGAAPGTAERRDWLVRLRPALPEHVLLLVNDDLAALRAVDGTLLADGVHLGREDAARVDGGLAGARRLLGPELLLGTSTRTLEEVRAARAQGADHAGFGAMAPSSTKAGTTPADPSELVRCLAALPDFPLFPIGGVGPHNLALLRAAGCTRAAVGSAVLDAADPGAAVRALLAALRP